MNVALVYDRINKWGGAERVLLSLHTLFPHAPLFTSVYNAKTAPWADVFTVKPSTLNHIPFAKSNHEYFAWMQPLMFESFNFDAYDLVISVTSAEAKGIITKPNTLHICYCLTPTRYLWSHYDTYFNNPLLKMISMPAVAYLQKWDRIASTRPDRYIAISNGVKNRISTYYHRDADVIYPPLDNALIGAHPQKPPLSLPSRYCLAVSRLVHYKRIDIAIQACEQSNIPLVIVGQGREEQKLRRMAQSNTIFMLRVSDGQLAWLYQHAYALIVPQEEDFGLTMVESLYYGTPVIAFARGGAMDIVLHKKCGLLVSDQSITSFENALRQRSLFHMDTAFMKKHAELFSEKIFHAQFNEYITKHYKAHLAKREKQ